MQRGVVWLRGSGHRSPRGVVARVRGVSTTLHQPQRARQRGATAHARLPAKQWSKALPGPEEALGGDVSEEDPPVRPPLAVVPQQRSQDHRSLPHHRLQAAKDLLVVCEGGG